MRENIFYWKCDAPVAASRKQTLYHAEKYDDPGIQETARSVARDFEGGGGPVEPLGGDGDHYVYRFRAPDGRACLLRMNAGDNDDDYLLAETAVMARAARQGVPTPTVYATDIGREKYPVRYQIMEWVAAPSLATFQRAGTLDVAAAARASGRLLARLHGIAFAGAGFVDTERLARNGEVRGLLPDVVSYFRVRREEHLAYVRDHGLLDAGGVSRAERLWPTADAALSGVTPVLLHRDFTYWNTLGGPDRIDAVIDWDDAVGGDPADDLGVVNCFLEPDALAALWSAYADERGRPPDDAFRFRLWLHTFRNMLWKAKIRHQLGYFDKPAGFFLAVNGRGLSLRDYTRAKLAESLAEAERSAP